MTIKERTQVFYHFRTLLERDIERLADIVRLENGKTIGEAEAEVLKGIELTEFACSLPQLLNDEIQEVVKLGAVKMNIDTDGQYTFSRAIADYFFTNYNDVLRMDGGVGLKSAYFAETWLRKGADKLRDYVSSMCELLGSAGKAAS